jgi:hypothetical protein
MTEGSGAGGKSLDPLWQQFLYSGPHGQVWSAMLAHAIRTAEVSTHNASSNIGGADQLDCSHILTAGVATTQPARTATVVKLGTTREAHESSMVAGVYHPVKVMLRWFGPSCTATPCHVINTSPARFNPGSIHQQGDFGGILLFGP